MNKEQFKKALLERKERLTEEMDEWVKETLLPIASESMYNGNKSVTVEEGSLPAEISLKEMSGYLKENGFDVTEVESVDKKMIDFLIVGWD